MSEGDKIEQLRKEIERLSNDLADYQQQVNSLRNAIMNLTHDNLKQPVVSAPKPAPAKRPDLENFIGLRLIHLVGMVVLVIGLSIGVKYAIDSNLMSEKARISLAYGAGMILFFLSVQLRQKYPGFSAILFSGAMASLYFTTYAAFTYYAIFSFAVAFLVMIILTILTVYKAISYNRQEIALLGLVGAYGIPFLVSKNADRADLFFLYISLINSAVIFLCIKKQWKLVGRVAQAITWIIFIGWASIRFTVNMQWTAVLFMSFFFLLFHANLVIQKFSSNKSFSQNDVHTLCLNNIALYTGMLFVLGTTFKDSTVAAITLVTSIFIGLQAFVNYSLWKHENYNTRMLGGISLILFIVFIAFRWDGLTVTLLWLLTAVIIFITGAIKKWSYLRMAAILLMGGTLLKLVLLDSMTFGPVQKIISYVVLGVLLLVVSFFYQKFTQTLFHGSDQRSDDMGSIK